jgi:hypothetical protein
MSTPSILLTVILCLFLLLSSRRYFLFPFIMAACFVPMNQRALLFNLEFPLLRILVLIGCLRVILKGETMIIQWNNFDKLILIWAITGSLVYIVQQETTSAFINRSGFMFDSLGMYWLFRQVVRNWEDVYGAVKIFAVFAIITAPLIALEKFQASSFFSLFGPVVGAFNRGRFRAAGPFPHYIMMGCFWALLLPFFYAQIKAKKNVMLYYMANLSVLSNVYFSGSSTPIMTVVAIVFFLPLYSYRMHGKLIFKITCCCLFLLHLIMKAPVWHLISRIDVFGGSTGWHRYFLFDNFVNHMTEWFVLGSMSTAHWGYGQTDITNQFVLEGVRGGMITLILFITIIYNAVKIPGNFSLGDIAPEKKWTSWGICVAMLGHFSTFWGVSYFGQIDMLLYLTFALVGFTLEQSTTIDVLPLTSSR